MSPVKPKLPAPYHRGDPRVTWAVKLAPETLAELRAEAARAGTSASAVAREALGRELARRRNGGEVAE